MYGMSQELMDRMERRIREKVYREIQEEQEKMRSQAQEDAQGRERRARRARTESSQNQFIPEKPQRVQTRNQGQELQQQSFFLPILNSNRKTMDREEPDSHNDDYQKYLSRRQPPPKLSNSYQAPVSQTQQTVSMRASNKQIPAEEDEEKTLLYLQQCEQIISSLKELTTKPNRRSSRPKDSRHQTEDSFRGYPARSDRNEKETPKPSFNTSKNHSFRISASTPVQREDKGERERNRVEGSPNETGISRTATPVVSLWSSNNKKKGESKMQDYINEFDEFNEPEEKQQPSRIAIIEKKDKPTKARENNIKISPPKEEEEQLDESDEQKEEKIPKAPKDKANNYSISPPNQEEENQFDESQQEKEKAKPQPKPKQSPAKQKQAAKPKDSPAKPKEKDANKDKEAGKEKEKKTAAAAKQTKEEDPANEKNKQQAIVSYLKKARMRGNLLSQKIEQRKKQQPDQEEAS